MRGPACLLLPVLLLPLSDPARGVEVSTDYWIWDSAGLWNLNRTAALVDHVVHYGGQTYFAGEFQRAGLEPIGYHAGWDGSGWLAAPFAEPYAVYAGDLIAFTKRYDGTTTSAMVSSSVFAPTTLYGDDTRLAAAGISAAAGGALVVAIWNESQQRYEELPGAFTNAVTTASPTINALLPWQGGWIVAGSDFYAVGGIPLQYMAYWDGTQWNDWSRPTPCYALAELGGHAYVGDRQGLYRRDGNGWTSVASVSVGFNPRILALHVDGDDLYVGGQFGAIGPLATKNIARLHNGVWMPMDTGIQGAYVAAIATAGSLVYAGGAFGGASGENTPGAAFWDGARWHRMGAAGLELSDAGGNPTPVRTWALHDGGVYAGGDFAAWGAQELDGIGQLMNARWAPLSSGFDGPVNDLVTYDGDLVAVGEFTHAGTSPQPGVSRRVGLQWLPMTTSMNGIAEAAIVLGGDLYVGGSIYEIDGQTMNHVARYDGATWTRVGGQVSSSVMCLGSIQGDLVMGGNFLVVEGAPMMYVARWGGMKWNAMGSGLPTPALALDEIEGVLYAGGNFGVRAWNGVTWTNLGSGVNGAVRDFAEWGGRVTTAGDFSLAGGQSRAGIACWDPVAQSWVDPGFTLREGSSSAGAGRALLAVSSKLYLSGTFDSVERAGQPSVPCEDIAEITDATIVAAPPVAAGSGLWMNVSPNPLNPRTVIEYGSTREGPVTVDVFDLRGRRIARLVDGASPPGRHETTWDGRDDAGRPVASGVYLVHVADDAGSATRKIVLAK